MPIHNADVEAVFTEIADLLEIEEANPFRIRAYRNAVRVVGDLGVDVQAMIASARPAGAGWRRTMCSILGRWPNCANWSAISRAGYRDGQEH